MKLIIQIPCYNEAETLGIALSALPRSVPGFDSVEWLIIDDGCSDATVEVAQKFGVDHIVRHAKNHGLAKAFMTGIEACLKHGADVIVNTDADDQYNADDIPLLTQPVIDGQAEIVVGARPISEIQYFSPVKKCLQKFGSWVVRMASNTDIPDAPSGFRAFSRAAAERMIVHNPYTYTLETIIQAGQLGMIITSVPIRVNADLRPSRLVKSIPSYIQRSIVTILRIFILYRPFAFFMTISGILIFIGCSIGLRFLSYWLVGEGDGRIQSLILASILLGLGGTTCLMGIIADLLAANRRLLEDVRVRAQRLYVQLKQNEK